MKKQLPPEDEWPSLPSTRAEAKSAVPAVQFYLTGQPCTNGHVAPRYTSNCTCVDCSAGQGRKWYDENLRPAVEERAAQREADRPAREAARRENRNAHARERRKQKMRDESTEEVQAKENEYSRERYDQNPEKERQRQRDRRARGVIGWKSHRLRTPPWLTPEEQERVEAIYAARTEALPVVDHYVPIDSCGLRRIAGLHVPWQLSLMTQGKNTQRIGVTFSPEKEEELVRRGYAVWADDVDESGNVDWDKYPRPSEVGGVVGAPG